MGRNLEAEHVVVLPIGGAHAAKQYVRRFAPRHGVKLSGLVDRAEVVHFRLALDAAGLHASSGTTGSLEQHGFFVCDADLEDELIRALDQPDLESLLASQGDLGAFRSLQNQPSWRDRPYPAQMHRWLRSVALRRSRYAQLLILRADPARIPPPLRRLVERI